MPIVPRSNPAPQMQQDMPQEQKPSPMAMILTAATMEAEGKFIHTIERGPEYDKWDEALNEHGAIRVPKDLDNPQEWMNQKHIKEMIEKNDIERVDEKDGSVILRKRRQEDLVS